MYSLNAEHTSFNTEHDTNTCHYDLGIHLYTRELPINEDPEFPGPVGSIQPVEDRVLLGESGLAWTQPRQQTAVAIRVFEFYFRIGGVD